MAIAKMKRLHLIALQSDREALLARLVKLGCVHLDEPELPEDLSQKLQQMRSLQTALATLTPLADKSGGLLTPRRQISEQEFMNDTALQQMLHTAQVVNEHTGEIERLKARQIRLQSERMTLLPWKELDVPLEYSGSRTTRVLLGALPMAADWQAVQGELSDRAEAAELYLLGESREQKCVMLLCHKDTVDAALEVLRSRGFTASQLNGMSGTVAENLQRLEEELKADEQQMETLRQELRTLAEQLPQLQQSVDRMGMELRTEENRQRLLSDGCVFFLEGWVPEKKLAQLDAEYEKILQH